MIITSGGIIKIELFAPAELVNIGVFEFEGEITAAEGIIGIELLTTAELVNAGVFKFEKNHNC